jgi:hypothetical protein
MAAITDDSQLVRFFELSRFFDERNIPTRPQFHPPAYREDIEMYTLRSSVLWPRALHGIIQDTNPEDIELRMQSGWFFRPLEHAGGSWQRHLQGWLERILLREACAFRRPSRERLEKMLWGRKWENYVKKNGEFIAVNMNIEDVGLEITKPGPGRRHEKLILSVDELVPLLRNILLMWCSAPKNERPWDQVDVVPMVRSLEGDFWETGEMYAEHLRLGMDKTLPEETKALVERLKDVTHVEVLTKLAADGVELGEGWEQWDWDYEDNGWSEGESEYGEGEDGEVEETEELVSEEVREERRHAVFMKGLEIRRPGEDNPYAHTGYEDEGDEEFETRMEEPEGKILEWEDEKFWKEKRAFWGLEEDDVSAEVGLREIVD